MQRRKPFELEIRKNHYISHLKKLEELKSPNNQFHRSLKK
jgi:hypothetical protein